MPRLVIVGHGMASQRLLEKLVSHRNQPWQITVLGAEPVAAYNRILLSPLLAGERDESELPLVPADWYRRHGIELIRGEPVTMIDRERKQLLTRNGRHIPYDRLVLATGASPSRAASPGMDLEGVLDFRTLADTQALMARARDARRALVVGGGFLGLEAADGLRQQGLEVHVIHRNGHLLNRQLDGEAGQLLASRLRQRGLRLHLGASLAGLHGASGVQEAQLADGTRIEADLVVMAAGIQPNRALAEEAGLACDRGVLVDGRLTTSDPAIHALGECSQFGTHCYGLVDPVYRQAGVLARVLAGDAACYQEQPVATRIKISGIDLFSCGRISVGPDTESVIYRDRDAGEYRHLILRDQRLVGAILFGDARSGPWYHEQLLAGTDLGGWRDHLAFGPDFCRQAA